MKNKMLLLGGGGHCKSVLGSILTHGYYTEIAIVDVRENIGKSILNIPIIGCDDDLSKLYQRGFTHAFITIGSIGCPSTRVKLMNKIEEIGFKIPNIVDSTAMISEQVVLAGGIYVGKNVVVNAGTTIGKGAIINTSSTIEHDCCIGEFSHIASGTILCGEVTIGQHSHIGASSVIKQQVKIGSNTIIGLGSVVLNDIPEGVIAYGNPCKKERTR